MESAIIINPDLPTGLLANAVACITSGLFVNGADLVGSEIKGQNVSYIPITKIPILLLKPGPKTLLELCKQAQLFELKYIPFTKEAQQTIDYTAYTKSVENKPLEEVNLLGLGVVGPDNIVNSLVGNLPMLR